VRILHISDVHGRVGADRMIRAAERVGAKLIVMSGDIESASILRELASSFQTLYSSGNMDPYSVLETAEELGILLDGRIIELEGMKFAGVGPYTEKKDEEKLSNLVNPDDRWVLVSHVPPLNTQADLAFIGRHIGSRRVRRIVRELKPLACLCGHVHESPAIFKLWETLVVNPGPAFRGRCAVVDLDSLAVEHFKF